MNKITVIVPCYNEEQSLHFFYEEMERVAAEMKEVAFEYLFIDDGSKDKTLECIHELKAKDEKVHYVSFSRNFGKEAAIYAGLSHASGIMWQSWMRICRTRLLFCRRCIMQ